MSFFDQIYQLGMRLKGNTEYLSYGRDVVSGYVKEYVQSAGLKSFKVLDIGCGNGDDLIRIRDCVDVESSLYGIEVYDPYRRKCQDKGINVNSLNIEVDPFPYTDAYFDVIVINQVVEHVKEIFYVFSEISRVVKPSGLVVVGIPNIASWHDRLAILLGNQPTCLKTLGPHVRGFTVPSFRKFIECDGYFKVCGFKGSGFYPFPAFYAKLLSRLFPSFSTSIFFDLRRTEKPGNFIEVLNCRFFETNFYNGTQK